MKIPRLVLAAGLAAGAISSAVAADYQRALSRVYRLRLRAAPSTQAPVVGHLTKNETVFIVDKSTFTAAANDKRDYWFQVVNSSGTKGWVFGGHLHFPPETK